MVRGTGFGASWVVDIGVPTALLTATFFLKLLIDRHVNLPMFIEAVYELPAEMGFLATSFVAAFTVSSTQHTGEGLLFFIIYIACAILTVFFWRRSQALFEVNKQIASVAFFVANFALSLGILVNSIMFIVRVTP